jgi:hypothetical protein
MSSSEPALLGTAGFSLPAGLEVSSIDSSSTFFTSHSLEKRSRKHSVVDAEDDNMMASIRRYFLLALFVAQCSENESFALIRNRLIPVLLSSP